MNESNEIEEEVHRKSKEERLMIEFQTFQNESNVWSSFLGNPGLPQDMIPNVTIVDLLWLTKDPPQPPPHPTLGWKSIVDELVQWLVDELANCAIHPWIG